MKILFAAALIIAFGGCAGYDFAGLQSGAESWCKQNAPGQSQCASAQVAAFHRIQSLYPSAQERGILMRMCGAEPNWWLDYVAADKCLSARRDFAQQAGAQPIEFDLDGPAATEAWGRAQAWVARYSPRKVQTATEFLIETYGMGPQLDANDSSFAYRVTRSPLSSEKSHFVVKCFPSVDYFNWIATENAHQLAFFMVSGKGMVP